MNQKEKRTKKELSNDRILDSAIYCFGRHGYANCSVMGIARRAEVTAGLVIQRYFSKEDLLFKIHKDCILKYYPEEDVPMSVRDRLISVLHQSIELKEKDPNAFQFLKVFLSTADAPNGFKEQERIFMEKRIIYRAIASGQMQGILPHGDTFGLLQMFLVHIFNQIDTCELYSLPFPSEDEVLKYIQYKDIEIRKREQKNEAIRDALIELFQDVTYINLQENTAKLVRLEDKMKGVSNINDARTSMMSGVEFFVSKEDREQAKAYFNFDTLAERLNGKSNLSLVFHNEKGELMRNIFVPIYFDDDGNIIEVMSGLESLS